MAGALSAHNRVLGSQSPFVFKAESPVTLAGPQPDLNSKCVDREANPESKTKELWRREVRQRTGREEYGHNRPRRGDAQKDCNRPSEPTPLQPIIASARVSPCAEK